MTDARKDIIFRDEDYKEKFRIKDGESIKITYGYDGEEVIRKCRFIDEAHLNVGSSCYHSDEFMEKMTRASNKYEPVPNQEPKLDVLITEPGTPPRNAEIPMSLSVIRELLGGEPEVISQDKFLTNVTGKNGNGTIIACGANKGNLTSLHPYDAQKYKRDFAASVSVTGEKPKPTLAEKLKAGKAKAAAHNASRPLPDKSRRVTGTTEHE